MTAEPRAAMAATAAAPGCGDFKVRDLRREDLAAVVRIDADHSGVEKPLYWQGVFEAFIGSRRHLRRVGLGADTEGDLVGYLLGEVRAFEFGSEPCGWVFAVGVDARHLRGGLGHDLLRRACDRFRGMGVRRVRTMVRRDDIPVMSFFRSGGFVGGAFYQLETDLQEDDG